MIDVIEHFEQPEERLQYHFDLEDWHGDEHGIRVSVKKFDKLIGVLFRANTENIWHIVTQKSLHHNIYPDITIEVRDKELTAPTFDAALSIFR